MFIISPSIFNRLPQIAEVVNSFLQKSDRRVYVNVITKSLTIFYDYDTINAMTNITHIKHVNTNLLDKFYYYNLSKVYEKAYYYNQCEVRYLLPKQKILQKMNNFEDKFAEYCIQQCRRFDD